MSGNKGNSGAKPQSSGNVKSDVDVSEPKQVQDQPVQTAQQVPNEDAGNAPQSPEDSGEVIGRRNEDLPLENPAGQENQVGPEASVNDQR